MLLPVLIREGHGSQVLSGGIERCCRITFFEAAALPPQSRIDDCAIHAAMITSVRHVARWSISRELMIKSYLQRSPLMSASSPPLILIRFHPLCFFLFTVSYCFIPLNYFYMKARLTNYFCGWYSRISSLRVSPLIIKFTVFEIP